MSSDKEMSDLSITLGQSVPSVVQSGSMVNTTGLELVS